MKKSVKSISINLLPINQDHEQKQKILKVFAIAFVVLILGLGSHYYFLKSHMHDLQSSHEQLKNQLDMLHGTDPQVAETAQLKKLVSQQQSIVDAIRKGQIQASPLLEEIEANIPKSVTLVSLAGEGDKIILNGTTKDYGSIARFIRNLNSNSRFAQLTLMNAQMDEAGRVDFTLQMNWGGTQP